ncbi:MAG: hypothetical protein AVDCRST_MAG65-1812, partial [uncultured Solirubrobacteraceae bacterium]
EHPAEAPQHALRDHRDRGCRGHRVPRRPDRPARHTLGADRRGSRLPVPVAALARPGGPRAAGDQPVELLPRLRRRAVGRRHRARGRRGSRCDRGSGHRARQRRAEPVQRQPACADRHPRGTRLSGDQRSRRRADARAARPRGRRRSGVL